jgi:uncharacterized RDD family membrane protein YckC
MQPCLEAKFWKRVTAGLIDATIIYFHASILTCLFHLTFRIPMPAPGKLGPPHFLIASSIILALSWLYFALTESSAKQASLGKLALGLMVTDLNGGRLRFQQATLRFLLKIVSLFVLLIPLKTPALACSRVSRSLVVDKKDRKIWQLAD